MTRLVYAILPLVGGALIAAQAPINARLRIALGSPVGSAFVSFAVGTILLLIGVVVVRDTSATFSGLLSGPWWAYLGGACGAVLVLATLLAAPRVGVTTTFVAVIVGQVLLSALIDRFGWFAARSIPITTERLVAIGLMVVAVVLLARQA